MTTPLPKEYVPISSVLSILDRGIVSGAGSNSISDYTKRWTPGIFKNKLLMVGGRICSVIDNSNDSIVVQDTISVGAGSEYIVLNAEHVRKTTQVILVIPNLPAGVTTALANCSILSISDVARTLALTVAATYNAAATRGLRVHVRSSFDSVAWDTEDWDVWVAGFTAGATIRQTENYDTDPIFLRVLIENLDPAQAITDISVISSLGA